MSDFCQYIRISFKLNQSIAKQLCSELSKGQGERVL